tara:strand:- start:2949 stop:5060 length:2112 start_codon:yes stop_codon:yes gene_type:complete
MTDICIRHPEFCKSSNRFEYSQSFGSNRTHKNEFRPKSTEPETFTTRRFGVREIETPPQGGAPRRNITDVPTTQPTVRRFGIRETGTEPTFGKHIRNQRDDPPPILRGISKKYNKKLAAFKEKQLKNLDLGLQESLESLEQHKYARLSQGAYDQAFKSKAKAMNGLKETGKYIPELNDFEIVPEFTNNNFTAYRNRVTGERHFAVRGSDTDFFSVDKNIESLMKGKGIRAKRGVMDWVTNAKFVAGKHQSSERYREGENLFKEFAASEGVNLTEVTTSGHSLGGGLAKYLSRKFGSKAFVFNAASNPIKGLKGDLKIKDFHPKSFVKSFRTYGDGVSIGEVLGNKEPQLEVVSHTSMPGHETSVVGQHTLADQFLPSPEDVEIVTPEVTERTGLLEPEPKVRVRRTTKFRNVSGLTGGTVKEIGMKNALMAIPAVLLEPEYSSAQEKKFRRTELGIDLGKGMLEFEGAQVFKLGEGGLPLNESGTFMDLWIGDLIGGADAQEEGSMANKYHKFMKSIREPIFGKDAPEDNSFKKSPELINSFNKMTKNLFGNSRYDADVEKALIQEQADAYGISFEEAYQMTPETDTGKPLSEGAIERQESYLARAIAAAPERGPDRAEYNFTRELKSYEVRDPETGRILIDTELYDEYKIQEAGEARWAASQEEIRQAQQAAEYENNYTGPVYSQSRRNITEIYSDDTVNGN